MTTKYIKGLESRPNGLKVFQIVKHFANIFHSEAIPNLPRFEFLVCKTKHLATLRLTFEI
jgi:hypothetical protein